MVQNLEYSLAGVRTYLPGLEAEFAALVMALKMKNEKLLDQQYQLAADSLPEVSH